MRSPGPGPANSAPPSRENALLTAFFRSLLEPRGDPLHRLRRGDHGDHVHVRDVAPAGDPLVEEPTIVALHDLIATAHVRRHPARDVLQPVGRLPSLVPEPPVDRHRISVLEALDDHVEHGVLLFLSVWVCGPPRSQRTRPARRGRKSVSSGKRIRINRPTNSEIRYGQYARK